MSEAQAMLVRLQLITPNPTADTEYWSYFVAQWLVLLFVVQKVIGSNPIEIPLTMQFCSVVVFFRSIGVMAILFDCPSSDVGSIPT